MKIKFEAKDKPCRIIDVFGGMTLMEAAVQAGIEEIEAVCGGGCACGTCHVYINDSWRALVGPISSFEFELLESLDNKRPNSRLACQINLTAELDGMGVDLPERNPL